MEKREERVRKYTEQVKIVKQVKKCYMDVSRTFYSHLITEFEGKLLTDLRVKRTR